MPKKIMQKVLPLVSMLLCTSVLAGPATDAMSTCLADSTSGKDRKELARWIFSGIAAHPELADLSSVTSVAREKASQHAADILTRLISEDCAKQTRTAVETEGPRSIQMALSVLGQLAMQEIMSNQAVNDAISALDKYVDRKKIDAALGSK